MESLLAEKTGTSVYGGASGSAARNRKYSVHRSKMRRDVQGPIYILGTGVSTRAGGSSMVNSRPRDTQRLEEGGGFSRHAHHE